MNPKVMMGKPVIKGTLITIELILGKLSEGARMASLPEDKDFGQLVFAHSRKTRGVFFIRYPVELRQKMCKEIVNLVKQCGDDGLGPHRQKQDAIFNLLS